MAIVPNHKHNYVSGLGIITREDGIQVAWLGPGYSQWGHGIFSKNTGIQSVVLMTNEAQSIDNTEWNACCGNFG